MNKHTETSASSYGLITQSKVPEGFLKQNLAWYRSMQWQMPNQQLNWIKFLSVPGRVWKHSAQYEVCSYLSSKSWFFIGWDIFNSKVNCRYQNLGYYQQQNIKKRCSLVYSAQLLLHLSHKLQHGTLIHKNNQRAKLFVSVNIQVFLFTPFSLKAHLNQDNPGLSPKVPENLLHTLCHKSQSEKGRLLSIYQL